VSVYFIFIREKSICKRLFSGRIILTEKEDNPRFRSRGELISVTPAAFEIASSSLLLPIFFKSTTPLFYDILYQLDGAKLREKVVKND
jgi:hypothetical protein